MRARSRWTRGRLRTRDGEEGRERLVPGSETAGSGGRDRRSVVGYEDS